MSKSSKMPDWYFYEKDSTVEEELVQDLKGARMEAMMHGNANLAQTYNDAYAGELDVSTNPAALRNYNQWDETLEHWRKQ